MNKIKLYEITKILYIIFGISTILAIYIVYRDLINKIAFNFLIGYLFLTLLLLIYLIVIFIINLKKLKWIKIRNVLLKFLSLFILFGILNYIIDFLFRPSNIDIFKELSVALGISFSISFGSVIFLKHEDN